MARFALTLGYSIERFQRSKTEPSLTVWLLPPQRAEKRFQRCYAFRMSIAIQAELPPELLAQARAFVEEGWAPDVNELLAEALRRYLESHSSLLSETFIREDIEWGLNGDD